MRKLLLLLLLFVAAPVSAQVVNPGGIEFIASADHDAVIDGLPVVTSYQFDTMILTVSGVLAFTKDLGKPTPNSFDQKITARIPEFLTLRPGSYVATVSALGPGGTGRSEPSLPFTVMGGPSAPTVLIVVP